MSVTNPLDEDAVLFLIVDYHMGLEGEHTHGRIVFQTQSGHAGRGGQPPKQGVEFVLIAIGLSRTELVVTLDVDGDEILLASFDNR